MEMQGISSLTRQASATKSKTFVALDELGRSTAPADGAAICASVIRYLGQQNAISLVATHFRSIVDLWSQKHLGNSVALKHFHVVEADAADPIFTHQLRDGPAPSSHALHVAMQAGVPQDILDGALYLRSKIEEKD